MLIHTCSEDIFLKKNRMEGRGCKRGKPSEKLQVPILVATLISINCRIFGQEVVISKLTEAKTCQILGLEFIKLRGKLVQTLSYKKNLIRID